MKVILKVYEKKRKIKIFVAENLQKSGFSIESRAISIFWRIPESSEVGSLRKSVYTARKGLRSPSRLRHQFKKSWRGRIVA